MIKLTPQNLAKILVEPGHIKEKDFVAAVKAAARAGKPLVDFLVDEGYVSAQNLGRALADAQDLPFVDLEQVSITGDLLKIIPELAAKNQQAIAFEKSHGLVKIATAKPDNFEFFKLLEKKTGHKAKVYYALPNTITEALRHYQSGLAEEVTKLIAVLKTQPNSEESVVKLVNLLLDYAHDNRASDIHLEPLEGKVIVRFRIDGVLHEVADYPSELHKNIVFRVKIMARLRTDEHAAAQDGRFNYTRDKDKFDVRVSVMPVTDGENIVMRLLSERSRRLSLEELGFLEKDLEKVKAAMKKPYGMILVVGPTGSGKTTTLYGILQILNKPEINIMTIEDPVEYDVERVQQTQVNPKKNLTFATGLRSIVRQDPDTIMVGEIRDEETADIAVNAAMTGHLLLSTLHANNAATTFPRLIEMGIESFLAASSINIVVAQRLVRKMCMRCRQSQELSREETAYIENDPELLETIRRASGQAELGKVTFFKGIGCKSCNNTGYAGRTGLFEVLEMSDRIKPLIISKTSADVIDQKAQRLGMTTIIEDGITKALQGITTVEEVLRVTKS